MAVVITPAVYGESTAFLTSAADKNPTVVKAGPGNITGISVVNTTATLYYLRLYNLASAPDPASATGFVESIPIPASTTGAGIVRGETDQRFSAGIGFVLTGGGSSTDNTNAATGVYITIRFK